VPAWQQKESEEMIVIGKRLFVGIKMSASLRNELSRPAPGTEHYLQADDANHVQIVNLGEETFIGRYVEDGFPAADIDNVGRKVCNIIRLITRGHRIEEDSVHIYAP
jgi:hypothetical protein